MPETGGSGRVHLHSRTTYTVLLEQLEELTDSGVDIPCRRLRSSPEWWFSEDPSHIRRAKMLCRICPVVLACRAHGLSQGEFGIWGGLDNRDRREITRQVLVNSHTGEDCFQEVAWASS